MVNELQTELAIRISHRLDNDNQTDRAAMLALVRQIRHTLASLSEKERVRFNAKLFAGKPKNEDRRASGNS